jgi:transcriptional repressor NrdR
MKCPFCANGENKVIDSRISKDGNAIRRRRECIGCSKRFTTYEYVEEVLPMEDIVERIEHACQDMQLKEIATSTIGEKVMNELHKLDGVAYVRFASVYKEFKDPNEFLDQLKDFLNEKEKGSI